VTTDRRHAEVAVLGAGPAGLLAASRLAASGVDTLVIGRSGTARAVGEVLKASARVRLDDCWTSVSHALRPIHEIVSRWGDARADTRFSVAHPHGPGWLVDRPRLERALLGHCLESGGRRHEADAERVDRGLRGWSIGLDDGRSVSARFLVDGSGRAAVAVRRRGSRTAVDQLVAHTRERAGGNTSPRLVVEAQPDGWRSTVPTFDGSGVIETLVGDGDASTDEHRAAGMAIADWTEDDLVPVGDALMSFDPLSGDGLGFGIVSAQEAASVIRAALHGDDTAVRRYREGAHRLFRQELDRRRDVYLGEQRWADRRFWQRRHRSDG